MFSIGLNGYETEGVGVYEDVVFFDVVASKLSGQIPQLGWGGPWEECHGFPKMVSFARSFQNEVAD